MGYPDNSLSMAVDEFFRNNVSYDPDGSLRITATSADVKLQGKSGTLTANTGAAASSLYYNVKSSPYSAAGDGVTDDTNAIQTAINDANAAGGGTVFLPAGTYFVNTQLTMKQGVCLSGNGRGVSTLKFSDTSSALMITGGGALLGSATTPSIAGTTATRSITMTSVSGWAIGDWVSFQDNVNFRGWVDRVASISGSVVTFEDKSPQDFPTTTTVQRFTPLTGVTMKDLTVTSFTGNCQGSARLNGAWWLTYAVDSRIDNCEFIGIAADTSGIGVGYGFSRGILISNCTFDRCADSNPTPTQNTRVVEIRLSTAVTVSNNRFRRCGGSASVSFTGDCHLSVTGNEVGGYTDWVSTSGGTSPLSTDNGGRGIKLIGGCKYFTIANNTVHDAGYDGIRADGCSQGTIIGNSIFDAHDVSIFVGSSDVAGGSDIQVIGNVVDWPSNATGSASHGIAVLTNTPRVVVSGNKISNLGSNGTAGVYSASSDVVISDNLINIGCAFGVQLNAGATRNIVSSNIIRGATAQSVDSSLSSGANFIWGNIGNTSYNVKTTATADSLDLVTGTTTSPGKNVVA